MRKSAVVLSATVVLILASAGPAFAVLEKTGTKSCRTGETAVLYVHAYGHEHDKGPGETSYVHRDFGTSFGWASNSGPGGYWRAYIPGDDYGGIANDTGARCIV